MSDLPALPEIAPGYYRHFKGGEYEVIGVVRNSETRNRWCCTARCTASTGCG